MLYLLMGGAAYVHRVGAIVAAVFSDYHSV